MGRHRSRYGGMGRGMPREVRVGILRWVGRGEPQREVAVKVGVSARTVARVVAEAGGMAPRWKDRNPGRLSLGQREEISRRGDRSASLHGRAGSEQQRWPPGVSGLAGGSAGV